MAKNLRKKINKIITAQEISSAINKKRL